MISILHFSAVLFNFQALLSTLNIKDEEESQKLM